MEFREEGRDLQVATKYPRSVGRFLLRCGVNYFSLVPTSGTLEVAPTMGYADIIADITSTRDDAQGKQAQDHPGAASS